MIQLSDRQYDVVLCLLTSGGSNKQIAQQLGITEGTVKMHFQALFRKLGVNTRVAIIAKLQGGEQ